MALHALVQYSSDLMTFKLNLTRGRVFTTQHRANTMAVTSGASFFSSFVGWSCILRRSGHMKWPLRRSNSLRPHKQLFLAFTGKHVKGPASLSLQLQFHFIVLLVFIRNQFGMERFRRACMASLLWSQTAGEQASLASQTASSPPFLQTDVLADRWRQFVKNGGEEAVWLARLWAGYVDKQQINDNSNNSNGTQLFLVATHHVWSRLRFSSTNDRIYTHVGELRTVTQ